MNTKIYEPPAIVCELALEVRAGTPSLGFKDPLTLNEGEE